MFFFPGAHCTSSSFNNTALMNDFARFNFAAFLKLSDDETSRGGFFFPCKAVHFKAV